MNNESIVATASMLMTMSDKFQACHKSSKDVRMLRIHLILEEVAELIIELAARDQTRLLKEIADLMYVTIGLAVTYDLPSEAGFFAVHESNMTKGSAAANHDGDHGKGPEYKKADIAGIIAKYESQKGKIRI